jgi:hypothetical protein
MNRRPEYGTWRNLYQDNPLIGRREKRDIVRTHIDDELFRPARWSTIPSLPCPKGRWTNHKRVVRIMREDMLGNSGRHINQEDKFSIGGYVPGPQSRWDFQLAASCICPKI